MNRKDEKHIQGFDREIQRNDTACKIHALILKSILKKYGRGVLWDVKLYSLTDRNGGIFHPKMEERGSSGTKVPVCHTAWHTPDDNNMVFNFCLDLFHHFTFY
jgi:hypothetical protein